MKITVDKCLLPESAMYQDAAREQYDRNGWFCATLDVAPFEEMFFQGHTEEEAKEKAVATAKELMADLYRSLSPEDRMDFLEEIGGHPVSEKTWYVHPNAELQKGKP